MFTTSRPRSSAFALKVTVQVDGAISQSGTVVGDFTMLSVTRLFVGALPQDNTTRSEALRTRVSPQSLHPSNNFRGCLRQVTT